MTSYQVPRLAWLASVVPLRSFPLHLVNHRSAEVPFPMVGSCVLLCRGELLRTDVYELENDLFGLTSLGCSEKVRRCSEVFGSTSY